VIRRLDFWIGTRLFHPPVIWLCQRTGMTQYAVAAYAWLAATFTLVATLKSSSAGEIAVTVLISALAVITTVGTALYPDMPRRPSLTFRVFIWVITIINALDLICRYSAGGSGGSGWGGAWDAFALVGEYAKTIVTIPPRKRREPSTKAREAFS
jgi:hypothetical protein